MVTIYGASNMNGKKTDLMDGIWLDRENRMQIFT
jgi:hypothetical protein